MASKLGVASGPLVAAFLVGEGNYVNMIDVDCGALMCCYVRGDYAGENACSR
jgi:hypothetical protein